MSTQINVTVDSGGLRQRDQQQRQALRLGKVEGDASRRVEQQGQRAREATLRQQLLSPERKPLYGVPPAQAARREEPAAWRAVGNYAVGGIKISNVLASRPGNPLARTITLTTVENGTTQTFDLYEFPFDPTFGSTSTTTYGSGQSAYTHSNAVAASLPSYTQTPISDSQFTPARNAGFPAVKTQTVNITDGYADENYVIAHLPLSKDVFVLTIAGCYGGIKTARYESLVETVNAETSQVISAPGGGYATLYFRNSSATLTTSNPSYTQSSNATYAKSWLISRTVIKEIGTPSQVRTKLLQFVPQYAYGVSTNTASYTTYSRIYSGGGYYYPGSSTPYPPADYLWFWGIDIANGGLFVQGSYSESTQTVSYYTATRTQTQLGKDFYDLSLFGMWSYAATAACYTPGVFARLDNPNASYSSSLNYDLGYLQAQFFNGYTLPQVALQKRTITVGQQPIRFDIKKPPTNMTIAEESLKINKSNYASFNQPVGYAYVWDWGRAAFCRSKLLALGFTEADLTP